MDFKGQRLAELIGLYLITAVAVVAFASGWLLSSFAMMAEVRHRLLMPNNGNKATLLNASLLADIWRRSSGCSCNLYTRLAILQSQPATMAPCQGTATSDRECRC